MSESLLVGVLLSFSGGLQDAYTYLCRGHIYANAQTVRGGRPSLT